MGRKEDRAHALCLVFQVPYIESGDTGRVVERYFDGLETGTKGIDIKFVLDEFEGVVCHLEDIDGKINSVLTDWDLERLAAADLAILRLAVFELSYSLGVPPKVAINEAVDLAKQYSTEDSPKFINGVLSGVLKNIKSAESPSAEEEL